MHDNIEQPGRVSFFDLPLRMLNWLTTLTITEINMSKMHNPPHPGEVIREYFPETLTLTEVATRLGVTRQALSAVLNGRAGVSAEMAVRLSKALGTSADLWLGLQMQYDLWQVMKKPMPRVQRLAA